MSRGSNPAKAQRWSDRLDRFENSSQTIAQFCVVASRVPNYSWQHFCMSFLAYNPLNAVSNCDLTLYFRFKLGLE